MNYAVSTKKNSYLIRATQKNNAKFSYPKKSGNEKFQTQKNPLITLLTWNLEYPPGGKGKQWDAKEGIKGKSVDESNREKGACREVLGKYEEFLWYKYLAIYSFVILFVVCLFVWFWGLGESKGEVHGKCEGFHSIRYSLYSVWHH